MTFQTSSSSWLVRRPAAGRKTRLFCFPYAGGSAAAFQPWQELLGADIEVCAIQLPGRGSRWAEPLPTGVLALARDIAAAISGLSDLPFAFFGHSLGALIAFEVARQCKLRGLRQPMHLFASGAEAPQASNMDERLHLLDDEALISKLQSLNGTPPEILANRELMALALPVIRSDFQLSSDYVFKPGLLLSCPLTVLAGRHDPQVPEKSLQAWAAQTTGLCRLRWFEGDHFFIDSRRAEVIACIHDGLQAVLSP